MGATLARCPHHCRVPEQEGSRLVFVPGMGDAGPAAVLPRPPLPESLIGELRERLPNAVFASNPCRIRHFTQVTPPMP